MTLTRPLKPWLAGLASLFFPGLGQIYCARPKRGLVLALVTVLMSPIFNFFAVQGFSALATVLLLAICWMIFVVIDSVRLARKLGSAPLQRYHRWYAYLGFIALSVGLNSALGALYHSKSYRLPSSSMSPTILNGDFVMSRELDPKDWRPGRGDIVTFLFPKDESYIYMKRVIGVPGDRIEVRGKKLILNGKPIPRRQLPPKEAQSVLSSLPASVASPSLEVVEEELDGKRYFTLIDKKNEIGNEFGPVTVGEGSYFVMGDNRDFSNDSRYWGMVPQEKLLADVKYIYFSLDPDGTGIRWKRLGLRVE